MLYWICPECGHECSPAIRECPTCAAAEQAAPKGETRPQIAEQASTDILSLAQTIDSAPTVGLLSPASYRDLISAVNGHSAPVSAAVLTQEAPAEQIESPAEHINSLVKPLVESAKPPEPAVLTTLSPLNILAVKAARPPAPKPAKPAVSPVPSRATAPAVVPTESAPSDCRLKTAGLGPIGQIKFKSLSLGLRKAREQQVEPAPSRRQSVAFVREALPGAEAHGLDLANLTSLGEIRFTPVASSTNGRWRGGSETNAAPVHPKAVSLAFISSRLDPADNSLADLLRALEASAEDLKRDTIRAIQASFQEQPAELMLSAPTEIVTAPAPVAEQWLRTSKIVFTPKPPAKAGLATLSAGPQAPTLAGPCLPPQLRNLSENAASSLRPRKKRSSAPTWMVSVLVAMCLFVGAGAVLQYLTANRDAKAASVAPAPAQAGEPALTPVPVAEEHPGAKFVEVAGVRVVTLPNKKPQLQYLVINHSANELTGLNINIAVHSAESPTGTPLFRVSSIVPSLAANQSKEIRTDLDLGLKADSIPDWQSLRTEILIARQ